MSDIDQWIWVRRIEALAGDLADRVEHLEAANTHLLTALEWIAMWGPSTENPIKDRALAAIDEARRTEEPHSSRADGYER